MSGALKKIGLNLACLLAVLSSAPGLAWAADKKDGQEQIRRLQQKISVLEQEKSQILQEKLQLDGKLKDSSEQVGRVKRNADAAMRKGDALEQALSAAESSKTELADKLSKTEQALAEREQSLADANSRLSWTEEARATLQARMVQRGQEFSACMDKNENLYQLSVGLAKQYQERTSTGGLLRAEPITQLKRVELENMLEEYRDKLDQELMNQPPEERQKRAFQKTESERQARLKAQREQAQQEKEDKQQVAQTKRKEQSELNKWTRKVTEFFEGIEW